MKSKRLLFATGEWKTAHNHDNVHMPSIAKWYCDLLTNYTVHTQCHIRTPEKVVLLKSPESCSV